MGQEPCFTMPDGLDELRVLLEREWPTRRAALHASGVPLNEGEDANDDDEGDDENQDGADGEEQQQFDAVYVKKLRDEAAKHRREAREAKARAKEYEDQNKTEAQKLEERATGAEARASTAEASVLRMEVALDKAPEGMSVAQVRKLAKRLAGTTREELEQDAEELFADFFAPGKTDGPQDGSRRPRERLRPGAVPSGEAEETDPGKLAASVPRRY